jgi:hypothetical protein
LILTAPFCSLTHFSPYHFSTGFNKYYYNYHLKRLGFAILEIVENGNYFEYIAQELRRLPSIAEKYAKIKIDSKKSSAINLLINELEILSGADSNSKELLTFGYHVLARKNSK